ncbi:MAG TPA: hypothetical protein VN629_02175 [Castellaniella sp.]|nr:hypothetical protein [Castellaniella sp.]
MRTGGIAASAALVVLQGCAAVTAGQLVQAGYDAAKTTLTSSAGGADAKAIRADINAISVGQDVKPILASIGVPPKEKSGNLQGYVCYQYAGIYSATEDAVIVAKDDKVVFFGNSTCRSEMQAANFASGGKYAPGAAVPPSNPSASNPSASSPSTESTPASPASSGSTAGSSSAGNSSTGNSSASNSNAGSSTTDGPSSAPAGGTSGGSTANAPTSSAGEQASPAGQDDSPAAR